MVTDLLFSFPNNSDVKINDNLAGTITAIAMIWIISIDFIYFRNIYGIKIGDKIIVKFVIIPIDMTVYFLNI